MPKRVLITQKEKRIAKIKLRDISLHVKRTRVRKDRIDIYHVRVHPQGRLQAQTCIVFTIQANIYTCVITEYL